VLFLRSIIFIALFYLWTAVCSLAGLMTFMVPVERRFGPAKAWSRGTQKLLAVVVGIRQEHRGFDQLPDGPIIIACKHQSTWETTIFQGILVFPAIVLKKELLSVPLLGPYCQLLEMIAVDRAAGPKAMRGLLMAAKEAAQRGRPILIFPEGTRGSENGPPDYQAGIFGLYNHLKIPVIPVALNSGAYWLNDSVTLRPGKIIMEFLPAIEPGLNREAFMTRLTGEIEAACNRLLKLAEEASGSAPGNKGP
jgi:1-acyl-sn-glycerol-3-phosphate acyltransferase